MSKSRLLTAMALVLLLGAPHLTNWAEELARTAAGLPSMAFAPPGTAQQIAVLWEAITRRRAAKT